MASAVEMPLARAGRGSFILSALGGGAGVGAGFMGWACTVGMASSKAAKASRSFFMMVPSLLAFIARDNRGGRQVCPAGLIDCYPPPFHAPHGRRHHLPPPH